MHRQQMQTLLVSSWQLQQQQAAAQEEQHGCVVAKTCNECIFSSGVLYCNLAVDILCERSQHTTWQFK